MEDGYLLRVIYPTFPSPFSLPASTTKVVVQRDSTFLSPIYLDEADIIVVVSRRAGYKSCP